MGASVWLCLTESNGFADWLIALLSCDAQDRLALASSLRLTLYFRLGRNTAASA